MTEKQPDQNVSWRWLNWSIVLVFVAAVLMISLISAGVFDPKPIGALEEVWSLPQVTLEQGQRRLEWLEHTAPGASYSLRMTAALADGEVDSAYGLVIGEDQQYLAVAVSPVGYVNLWRQDGDKADEIIPWRTWPHIRQGQEVNEIWMDVLDGRLISVRTNREILWQGEEEMRGRSIGLWSETFGAPATFDFQQLELFADKAPNR